MTLTPNCSERSIIHFPVTDAVTGKTESNEAAILDDVASQTCSRLLTDVAAELVMGITVDGQISRCRYQHV